MNKQSKLFFLITNIVHILFGFVSSLLGFTLEASIIFIFYQFIDYEPPEEKLGDIIEFSVGLVAGKLISLILL